MSQVTWHTVCYIPFGWNDLVFCVWQVGTLLWKLCRNHIWMNCYCEFFHEFLNILEKLFHTHIIDLKSVVYHIHFMLYSKWFLGQVGSLQDQVQWRLTIVKWVHVVGDDDGDLDIDHQLVVWLVLECFARVIFHLF